MVCFMFVKSCVTCGIQTVYNVKFVRSACVIYCHVSSSNKLQTRSRHIETNTMRVLVRVGAVTNVVSCHSADGMRLSSDK